MADSEKQKDKPKRRKRIRGSGSVYQRSDGRWAADFTVEETGKRKTIYGRTEKKAWSVPAKKKQSPL